MIIVHGFVFVATHPRNRRVNTALYLNEKRKAHSICKYSVLRDFKYSTCSSSKTLAHVTSMFKFLI